MAVETSPTLTSTSHTLTALPNMAGLSSTSKSNASLLLGRLESANRHVFLQPDAAIPTESLNIVKDTLEGFAGQIAEQQEQKLKENRKRKRADGKEEVLKIRKVYVDGFETNQVWEQAKRIIGSVLKHADSALQDLQDNDEIAIEGDSEEDSQSDPEELNGNADEPSLASDDEDEELLSADVQDEDEEEDEWEDASEGLGAEQDDYQEDEEEGEEEEVEEGAEYEADPDGLNDGFFSLDDFNKQSNWFEQQDARGDPNTDAASDDEDIDWNADPLAAKPKGKSNASAGKKPQPQDQDDDEDDEDDGPTFGDMDLDAPEGASDDEAMAGDLEAGVDDEAMDFNANDVYYKDFFAPPKKKRRDDRPKKSVSFKSQPINDADVENAMADVRRDLFDDESDEEGSDGGLSDVSAGDPRSRRSAHERRQAKLAEEIRKLEAASIAKREWTLSGEAAAVDRPMNSLLEEDLDFEHVGKPVPVITPEITEGIEDLIKRRILAQEFDEVLRRRPGVDSLPTGTRRGMLEDVDDTKGKSLAEVYEEEHARKNNPDTYVSQSDEKLQREEREVEAMWRDVSARLDALSSWHYRPKPVEPTLSVVADVATVAMEDAQPTTAQGVAGQQSNMAPQEVYKTSNKTAEKGEVVAKSGVPIAKQEMSREDRTRRRRREKERVRKAGGVGPGKALSGRAKMQRDTMADLKKGGVKVINRKGEVTDVDGKKIKAAKALTSGSFKL
ncbi:hypothetical protein V2G26_003568 [Clonostachys chloroleuca]